MALRDQPYLPLYVQDFLTDEKLMECSASSTGIYIRILCVMHKSEEYGTLLLKQKDKQNGKQVNNFALKLARFMPYPENEIITGLNELITEGVLKIDGDKLIQKRMIRDNEISLIRAKAGKKGGEFAQAKIKAKGEANTENENEIGNEDIIKEKESEKKPLNISFETFWNLYNKKIDKKKCEPKWNRMTDSEREQAIKHIPLYIDATPDKKFRRNPETYLNNKSWENEIISSEPVKVETPKSYEEMCELVNKHGPSVWDKYKAVKRDNNKKAIWIPL